MAHMAQAPIDIFEAEWPEDTDIEWWNKGRRELNTAIRQYNNWLIEGQDPDERRKLLARIEYGRQTYGQRDGGSGWLEVLDRMKRFVEGTC